MITVDGSYGEGGGQIVRTALALSVCNQIPIKIINIRANRPKPGLAWQHLVAVKAAAAISNARVNGDKHQSQELSFTPNGISHGQYNFDIGTAGSTSLVLQTILPPLILSQGSSKIRIIGGTHNPLAPTYDFLNCVYFPLLRKMGVQINSEILRPGFYPRGGGQVVVDLSVPATLTPLYLEQPGKLLEINARAMVAGLPKHIAEREINTLQLDLIHPIFKSSIQELPQEYGPGNIVTVEVKRENITELFTAFGQKRIPAEIVASRLSKEVNNYLSSNVPVGIHLADQLVLPLALCGKGYFLTQNPSKHTLTNIHIIQLLTDINMCIEQIAEERCKISVA